MILFRLRQASLLLFAMLVSVVAFYQMFLRTRHTFPANYIGLLGICAALFLVLWGLLLKFQPYASQAILPCVLMLTAIGVVMIARIDNSMKTSVGSRQLIWLCLALVLAGLLIALLRDYCVLRRYAYVNMVIGLALLLSPMIPGLGKNINGAKIWIGVGNYTVQPAEFAKLFLAFFFAAYLFDHRDQLAVGGKKVLGLQLPRIKDLGPIIIIWGVSMGVLVMQRDLGTSLMFFAMFVAMLYVATGRTSWIFIGFIAFAVGAVAAASLFSHVGSRVDAWLHPFSDYEYNRQGGSWQLVTGIFGMAAGGMSGTGLGQGQPALTTYANSDFVYASIGEELGLTGLMAVLVLYLVIIASGFITAMKIKDGFGKLLASGLVFTMAFQVFTVVGGITLVIPLTGMTMPYVAAGGSSLVANYILAALLMVISNSANKPEPDTLSDTFQYEALAVLRDRELRERADREAEAQRVEAREARRRGRHDGGREDEPTEGQQEAGATGHAYEQPRHTPVVPIVESVSQPQASSIPAPNNHETEAIPVATTPFAAVVPESDASAVPVTQSVEPPVAPALHEPRTASGVSVSVPIVPPMPVVPAPNTSNTINTSHTIDTPSAVDTPDAVSTPSSTTAFPTTPRTFTPTGGER